MTHPQVTNIINNMYKVYPWLYDSVRDILETNVPKYQYSHKQEPTDIKQTLDTNASRLKNFKHNAKKFNAYETEYNTINKDFSEGKIDENTKKQAFESLENKFSIKVAEFELLLTERSNARKAETERAKAKLNPLSNEKNTDKDLDR